MSDTHGKEHSCSCQSQTKPKSLGPNAVYAIGRLEAAFPNTGLKKEFEARTRTWPYENQSSVFLANALTEFPTLARQVCFSVSIRGRQAYWIQPEDAEIRAELIKALRCMDDADSFVRIIGRANPGLVHQGSEVHSIQELKCHSCIAFNLADLLLDLRDSSALLNEMLMDSFRSRFFRLVGDPENIGFANGDRAINYLAMNYSGVYELDLEARLVETIVDNTNTREVVSVLFRHPDQNEIPAIQVDVNDEWPFLITHGASFDTTLPSGMHRYPRWKVQR